MAVVVFGFAASTAAAAIRTRAIASDVDLVTGSAMPSVEDLSAVRSRLHRLDEKLEQHVRAAESATTPPNDRLGEDRRDLDDALARYLALPIFDGEDPLRRLVHEEEVAVDRSIDDTLSALGKSDWTAARASLGEAKRVSRRADDALAGLVAFNAAQGERLGRHAAATRRRAFRMAFVLDGLVGLAAMFATLLAALSLRHSVRVLETATGAAEHRASILQQRSSELELFAGRVAHDIQSPLMAVGIGLQMSKGRLAADVAGIATIERATSSLMRVQRLVAGLLEFALAGARPGENARASLREGIDGVLADLEAEAEAARIRLVSEDFEDLDVACSAGVLASLVGNLVHNAIKYMGDSSRRYVTVRARDAGNLVRVEVEDGGPGIPAAMLDLIFEPFVRIGVSSAPGAGLGLATVKKLALAHAGSVGCESNPGSGSLFWFELRRPRPGKVVMDGSLRGIVPVDQSLHRRVTRVTVADRR
jgi:signal transduction histidine kinase